MIVLVCIVMKLVSIWFLPLDSMFSGSCVNYCSLKEII